MCGICGIAAPDTNAPIDSDLLRAMTDLQTHRGPDGEGFFVDKGIGLGMRRLSIVDLETGYQPIPSEDGSIQVVCNGEIYNAPQLLEELRGRRHTLRGHSDVEAVVHLYEEMGIDCLQHLRGMFGLAIWDGAERKLILARDRFGIKPLYYGIGEDGDLYFGSEAKSILEARTVDPTLDPVGLAGLLDLGGPLFDRTLFQGIRQVEPGYWLTFQSGQLTTGKYWDLDFNPKDPAELPKGEGEWSEAFDHKFREAVNLHLLGDVPMAAWLSPGVDSSSVACVAAEVLGQRLKTFSLGFDDPDLDELRTQKTLDLFPGYDFTGDKVLFTENVFERLGENIWHHEQPVRFQYNYQVLAGAMNGRFKVALTGQGSDEMLGGYPWYRRDRMWQRLYWMPTVLRRLMAKFLPARIPETVRRALTMPTGMSRKRFSGLQWTTWPVLRTLFTDDLGSQVRAADEAMEPAHLPVDFHRWDRFQQLVYIEAKTRMVSYINRGLDASSMARSVEPRLPFLDHELAELCMQIPPDIRHLRMEKHVLRKAMEPYLPDEIAWRRKRGMGGPDPGWAPELGPIPEFARELLEEDVIRSKGYFRPEAIRNHLKSQQGLDGPLAAVVGFHLWDEQFVQGKGLETENG
jgi:asparagine synthase (glutamine-hydrolysing)